LNAKHEFSKTFRSNIFLFSLLLIQIYIQSLRTLHNLLVRGCFSVTEQNMKTENEEREETKKIVFLRFECRNMRISKSQNFHNIGKFSLIFIFFSLSLSLSLSSYTFFYCYFTYILSYDTTHIGHLR
jgi:hypothetical protein